MREREEARRSLLLLFCLVGRGCVLPTTSSTQWLPRTLLGERMPNLLMNPGGWPPQRFVVQDAYLDCALHLNIILAYPEAEGEQSEV